MEQDIQIDYQLYLEELEIAKKYPKYCGTCIGWGVLYDRNGDKTGICPDCVGQGKCPRCATDLANRSCPSCGWKE